MMRSAMVLVVGLCVLIFSALSSLASSGRVALVIGNSAYSQVEKIRNPGNDATAIGAALRRMGFEVTVVHDATKVEFRSVDVFRCCDRGRYRRGILRRTRNGA
ncbi:caspase family protein [Rhizobium leguminosarum]|nr:caspase family protein [Rhizobium leguminosarum]